MAKLLFFNKIAQPARAWRSHLCAHGDATPPFRLPLVERDAERDVEKVSCAPTY